MILVRVYLIDDSSKVKTKNKGKIDMLDITQEEIKRYWDTNKYNKPLVTIRCMTYNHEKYIASAIEGFLKQKTFFPFQIFIHDDCSTDTTPNVIMEYQKKYPDIINAVYESENQWSKKNGALEKIIRENIHSKYVALCEGDDYWIDEYKLEKQIEYLERHSDCAISITNGKVLNLKNGKYESIFLDSDEEVFGGCNQRMTLANCASILFPPTASYVYRYDYGNGIDQVPKCFNGDLRQRLYYMTKGYCYYFKDETVVYRKNVEDSAMSKAGKQSRSDSLLRAKKTCEMIDYIDKLSNYEHSNELWKIKLNHALTVISNSQKIGVLKDPVYYKVFRQCTFGKKLKILIKIGTPEWLYKRIKNIL